MKTNEKYNDRGLRLAMKRKYEDAERMKLSDDFDDRLMQQIEQKPKHRHLWLYPVVGAVAACILLLLILNIGQGQSPRQAATTDKSMATNSKSVTTNQSIGDHQIKIDDHQICNRAPTTVQSGGNKDTNGQQQGHKRTATREIPDTLGNEIWQNPENVERAIRILADCETTILREEQEMRNMVIEATFRATAQPASAVLVTNEVGDYEVIETKRIIDI